MQTIDHAPTEITTSPQITRLHGDATTVDLTTSLTAECPHGHQHTLYITDISAMPDALQQIAEWADEHVDTCPGAEPPDDEPVHEECLGIHGSAGDYRNCDGNPI